MPRENSDSTMIRIHAVSREKLNRFLEHKPAFSIQAAVDEALELLLEREGVPEPLPAEPSH